MTILYALVSGNGSGYIGSDSLWYKLDNFRNISEFGYRDKFIINNRLNICIAHTGIAIQHDIFTLNRIENEFLTEIDNNTTLQSINDRLINYYTPYLLNNHDDYFIVGGFIDDVTKLFLVNIRSHSIKEIEMKKPMFSASDTLHPYVDPIYREIKTFDLTIINQSDNDCFRHVQRILSDSITLDREINHTNAHSGGDIKIIELKNGQINNRSL